MKIYFAASIRGGRKDSGVYSDIINHLKEFGEVLTEHVGYESLTATGEDAMNDIQIHDRDMEWLIKSDIVIAEVTNPSLGVGYELGRAIAYNKKILCLYRQQSEKKLSAMISGAQEIDCIKYSNIEELKKNISDYIKK